MMDPAREKPFPVILLARLWPYAVITAVVAVLFSPFLLQGYVLDGNHDRMDLVIPFQTIHSRAFLDFTIPHWNPYIFCGKNAHASALYPILYPPYWPAYLMGEDALPAALTVVLLVHVLLAGWFAFLFFRKISGQEFWSLAASVAYVLSSASIMQMTSGTINHAAFTWLPLLLYLAATAHERRTPGNIALTAAVTALLLLGANVQLSIYSLGIFLGYGLWRSLEKSCLAPAVAAFVGTALGAALSAVRYVPFVFAMGGEGEALSYAAFRAQYLTGPWHLMRLWTPEIFGARLHSSLPGGINHFEIFSAYVGVACALAALFSLVFLWNRRTAYFNIVSLFILAAVLGTPVLLVHYLALAKMEIMYNRLAWFLPICFCALFAANAETLFSQRKRAFLVFSAVVLTFSGVLVHFLVSGHFSQELGDANAPEIRFSIRHFTAFGAGALLAMALGAGSRFFKPAFFLLVAADLLVVSFLESGNSHPFFSPMPLFHHSGDDVRLAGKLTEAGNPYRVLAIPWLAPGAEGQAWTPNNGFIPLGAYNSSGYDNLAPPALSRLYRYPARGNRVADRTVLPCSERMLRLSSTGFWTDGSRWAACEDALSRLALFTRHETLPPSEAPARLADPDFPWQDTLVLDRDPGLSLAPAGDPGEIEVLSQGNNRLSIRVEARANALLLVNDTLDPGWEARLDGQRVPVLSANHAFMALAVPRGTHTVDMEFTPQGWNAGLLITALALLVLFALAGPAFFSRCPRRGETPA